MGAERTPGPFRLRGHESFTDSTAYAPSFTQGMPDTSALPAPRSGELPAFFAAWRPVVFWRARRAIALMHKELVEDRPMADRGRVLNAACSFCMLLPGPQAMQWAHILPAGARPALPAVFDRWAPCS